jgi:hypothetical protein
MERFVYNDELVVSRPRILEPGGHSALAFVCV